MRAKEEKKGKADERHMHGKLKSRNNGTKSNRGSPWQKNIKKGVSQSKKSWSRTP
jgi:hypothetical protein